MAEHQDDISVSSPEWRQHVKVCIKIRQDLYEQLSGIGIDAATANLIRGRIYQLNEDINRKEET